MEIENLRNLQEETLCEETSARNELEAATKETQRNKLECDGKVKVSKSFSIVFSDVFDLLTIDIDFVVVVPQTVWLNSPKSQ